MERTSLAFAVSFLGNWRAGRRPEDFWGLHEAGRTREGRARLLSFSPALPLSLSLSPPPLSLSLSLSLSWTKFIVAWSWVFCSLIPLRASESKTSHAALLTEKVGRHDGNGLKNILDGARRTQLKSLHFLELFGSIISTGHKSPASTRLSFGARAPRLGGLPAAPSVRPTVDAARKTTTKFALTTEVGQLSTKQR